MSSFKQLSKSDVTVVANNANKQWTLPYCPYPTSSQYLTIYKGTNVTGSFSVDNDPITEGEYERLIYAEVNQLFYQAYTASLNTASLARSIYYESASQQRPTSSYFIFNDNSNLIDYFPTGAMEGIRVLAINQSIFGNKVLPGNFQLSSSVYNVKDDAYGNLFDYSGSKTHVGNIFYAYGLAIVTNQDYQLMFPLPPIAVNDSGSFLTTDTPKTISASLNDYARSGTLNTGSIVFSGSISGTGYSWATGSNGTIVLTTTVAGTYIAYYTIGADIAGSCPVNLRSNVAKVTVTVTEPTTTTTTTTTSTTSTTTTAPTTTTTTTSTTTTTTTEPTTTTTSTTTTTTTAAPTTTSTTTTTTTAAPTTTTTSTTTTTTTSGCTVQVTVDNNATGGIGCDIVYVNGVAVTYDSGDNFTVEPGELGFFTTNEIGTYTVEVSYTSHTGDKAINLVDCNSNAFCIDNLNTAGGTAVFENVVLNCPCGGGIQIIFNDGDCL